MKYHLKVIIVTCALLAVVLIAASRTAAPAVAYQPGPQPVPTNIPTVPLPPDAYPSAQRPIEVPNPELTVFPTSPPVTPEPVGATIFASFQRYDVGPDKYLMRYSARYVSYQYVGLDCSKAVIEFGDSITEPMPCVTTQSIQNFGGYHTYIGGGVYYPRFIVTTVSGEEYVSKADPFETSIGTYRDRARDYRLIGFCLLVPIFVAFVILLVTLWQLVGWQRGRRAWWLTIAVFGAVALFLVTWVPPFSYLPNPLGYLWRQTKGYSYDPRSSLKNDYIVAQDPTKLLAPQLDKLLDKTGLDPLDPVHPLARYEVTSVQPLSNQPAVAYASVNMTYRNGTTRAYDLPVLRSDPNKTTYLEDWIGPALTRLQTQHRGFLGIPLVAPGEGDGASVSMQVPVRLPLGEQVQQAAARDLDNWLFGYGYTPQQHKIEISSDGSAFLTTGAPQQAGHDGRELWLVPLDGSAATRIAADAIGYGWSPDGSRIIYNRDQPGYPLMVSDRQGSKPGELYSPGNRAFPALTDEGAWYVGPDGLKLVTYAGEVQHSVPLWNVGAVYSMVEPTRDGSLLVYNCLDRLCLQNLEGTSWIETHASSAQQAAWASSGDTLAATYWGEAGEPQATILELVNRDGTLRSILTIAPDGPTGKPQWTPDERYIFIQTYPQRGRRIIAVDTANSNIYDLTPPLWDPIFTMTPDGNSLLITNGRGGFWKSQLKR